MKLHKMNLNNVSMIMVLILVWPLNSRKFQKKSTSNMFSVLGVLFLGKHLVLDFSHAHTISLLRCCPVHGV